MTLLGIDIPVHLLEPVISQWGYLIVFLLAYLETSAFVGLLVPGETVVLLAAALASNGLLDPYWLAAVVSLAAVLGDSTGYLIGRRVGRDFLLRHPRLFHISKKRMEQADHYFARHGGKTIFFGRWIGFLRSLAPLLAGSARMPYRKFLLYDLAGALSWAVALTALGFVFGKSFVLVERWLGRLSLILAVFFVTVVGLVLLGRWLRSKGAAIGALAGDLADAILGWRVVRAVDRRFHREIGWVLRRFSPNQTFGLGLTLGLLTSALLLYVFITITRAVLELTPLVRIDGLLATELHARAFPTLTLAAEVVSFLSGSWMTVLISLIVAIALVVRRHLWLDALVLFTTAVGAGVLAQLLKVLIQRPRPSFADPLVNASGFSFPSGHATSSMAFYMALALLATGWVKRWEMRVYILVGAVAIVLAVGFSRLYLGAHYLTDVLAGYAAGAFWAAVCITAGAVLAGGHTLRSVQPREPAELGPAESRPGESEPHHPAPASAARDEADPSPPPGCYTPSTHGRDP